MVHTDSTLLISRLIGTIIEVMQLVCRAHVYLLPSAVFNQKISSVNASTVLWQLLPHATAKQKSSHGTIDLQSL